MMYVLCVMYVHIMSLSVSALAVFRSLACSSPCVLLRTCPCDSSETLDLTTACVPVFRVEDAQRGDGLAGGAVGGAYGGEVFFGLIS